MAIDPKTWAEEFVAELTVAGERVPFERVLAHHLDELTKLRAASGLTWRSMASLLIRAGARRANGGLISADQLRVSYARLVRHAEEVVEGLPAKADVKEPVEPIVTRPSSGGFEPRPSPHRARPSPSPTRGAPRGLQTSSADDEISDDEIGLALARLTKLHPK